MRNRTLLHAMVMIASLLVLAACGASQGENQPTQTADLDLANTSWTLVSYGAPDAPTPALPGNPVTLVFEADGRAGGNASCNSYGGSYQIEDGSIRFGEIVSTLMACVDAGVGEQEQRYLSALQTTGSVALSGDQLTIAYNDGQEVLTFTRAAQ